MVYIPDTYVTFTAQTHNTTANGAWSALHSNGSTDLTSSLTSVVNTHTGPSCRVNVPSNFTDGMVVTYTLASADGSIADSFTLRLIEQHQDTIVPIVINEAHVLPANADGEVSDYDGSGTQIFVFQGTTKQNFVTGTPGTAEWALGALTATALDGSAVTFTEGGISRQGSGTSHNALIADHSGAADGTDAFNIPLNITGKDAGGNSYSITKNQTLTKAKAGATSAGIQKYVTAYRAENKNPNPSSAPSANALLAPSGYSFDKPTSIATNKRLYQINGTLNNASDAYAWTVATSESSSQPFTFYATSVIDGGPDHAGATYEVNAGDIWYDTTGSADTKYIAQANFSDTISATEWKEVTPDDPPVIDDDESSLPDVEDYRLGDIILLGDEFYIALDF